MTARKPVHDRQRARRQSSDANGIDAVEDAVNAVYGVYDVEDIIPAEILNDTRVDREYLEQVFREPQKFLPPRERRAGAHAADSADDSDADTEQPPHRESTLARRAKLIGLLAAGALVIGSGIAASTLTAPHRVQIASEADTQGISGAAALGGFAVPDQAAPGQHHSTKTTPAAKQPSAQQSPAAQQEPGVTTPESPAALAPTSARSEIPPTTSAKLNAVKKFYTTVDSNPQGALALLDPLLAGEQPGDLVRTWASMTSIQLQQAIVQPDGSIKAVVMMLQPDGSHLLVTQLLKITDSVTNLISDAKLLSSQRQ
jgi:hypothetical protein